MQSIRVVVPNRPGLLAEITACLGKSGIDIDHIAVETHSNGALVRLRVERADDALASLTECGYHAVSDDVLLARIPDRPGGLAQLSRILADNHLDIRSMHHVRREGGDALVAIDTNDTDKARGLLGDFIVP